MKKFFIMSMLVLFGGVPSLGICSIETGMCRANVADFKSLDQKLIPNHLDSLKDPVSIPITGGASDLRYNFDSGVTPPTNSGGITGGGAGINTPSYDASCQFGSCVGRPSLGVE